MVSIGSISYLGSHGAELLRAGWTEAVLDPSVEEWVRRIHEFGREADTSDLRRRRVRIEDKGVIVAFHWRGAPDEDAARTAVDALAARADAAGLQTHWGRKVLEIRPPIKFDKGAGITKFLDGLEVDTVLYIGDDVTDVDAFRGLRESVTGSAVCVAVGSEEAPEELLQDADVVVDGPAGVRELLDELLR
jgi:trehalose 6-phosphate phosphatase